MDLPAFRRLLTPQGQSAVAAADGPDLTEASLLACHQRLRKQYPEDIARAAVETVRLRRKAADKFSRADRMYFTREALEQSSGEAISRYRARRFGHFKHIADLCCGIGGDLIGLSDVAHVTAVDADPLRLAMAAENVRAYQRANGVAFVDGDVLTVPLPGVEAAFCDP